ncbi:MAG: MBL fold metallo-hydrolase [Vicinamibacterales bacterium]
MENRPVPLFAENAGPLTGSGNNTYLLDGPEPMLVDAGVGRAAHVDAVAAALAGRPLARVLLTHGHPDHASGLPALRARWPAVVACQWGVEPAPGWQPLSDGDVVSSGALSLTVLHTPGHAADHVCFWDPVERVIFGGDMVLEHTTVMIPAGHGGGLAAYLASLERLAALRPARLYPGHGPVIEQPVRLIRAYVAHRRQREQQVLSCLARGEATVEAIVDRIYPDLAPGLRDAARLTVEAHLQKLRQEGRA